MRNYLVTKKGQTIDGLDFKKSINLRQSNSAQKSAKFLRKVTKINQDTRNTNLNLKLPSKLT